VASECAVGAFCMGVICDGLMAVEERMSGGDELTPNYDVCKYIIHGLCWRERNLGQRCRDLRST